MRATLNDAQIDGAVAFIGSQNFVTLKDLAVTLANRGVRAEDATGERFDPLRHQALSYEPVLGAEDGSIAACYRTLREAGFAILVTSLEDNPVQLYDADLLRPSLAEARRVRARVDLALEPADHHLLDALALGRSQLARLAEAHRIELLEQACEGTRVAVVRRGGEEETMLEIGRREAEHSCEVALVAEPSLQRGSQLHVTRLDGIH